MEKTIKKRMLALITALAVFFGMLPAMGGVAFAEETPSATVEDVSIWHKEIGKEITYSQNVRITLDGDTFKDIAVEEDVSNWFKDNCLPAGVSAKVESEPTDENTKLRIKFTGTPTERKQSIVSIEIPAGKLTKGQAIKVTKNEKATFEFGMNLVQMSSRSSYHNRLKVGKAIDENSFEIRLYGSIKFKETEVTEDVNSWFSDVPPGISITLAEKVNEDADTAKFKVVGTVTGAGIFNMSPNVPKDKLKGANWLTEDNLAPLDSEKRNNSMIFEVKPKLTISGPGFIGEKGQTLKSNEVILTVEGDEFKASEVSGKWLRYICVKMQKNAQLLSGNTQVKFTLSGIPEHDRDRSAVHIEVPYTAFKNYSKGLSEDNWQWDEYMYLNSGENTVVDIYWPGDATIYPKEHAEDIYTFDWDNDVIIGVPEGTVADIKRDLWTAQGGEFKVVDASVHEIKTPADYDNAAALPDTTPLAVGQKLAAKSPNGKGTKLYEILALTTPADKRAELDGLHTQGGRVKDENPGKQSGTKADPVTWNVTVINSQERIWSGVSVDKGVEAKCYTDSNFTEEMHTSLDLEVGSPKTIYVEVTSKDKTVKKYYAVTVNRAAEKSENAELTRIFGYGGELEITSKRGTEGTKTSPIVWDTLMYDGCDSSEIGRKYELNVSQGAEAALYSAADFSTEIKKVELPENVKTPVYIKVKAENGNEKYYIINITRKIEYEPDTVLRRVLRKDVRNWGRNGSLRMGTIAEPKLVSISVDGDVSKLTTKQISARSKQVELYSDSAFTNKVEELSLQAGQKTTAYIKVLSKKSFDSKHYAVAITRGQAQPEIPQGVQDAVSGYAGVYDKAPHDAVLVDGGMTAEYTVEFADAENGTYSATNPQITNVADSKDVWVRISKAGYAPFKKKVSAKVTPKALDITAAVATNRAYVADKKTVEVASVTFGTEVLAKDTDYTATGTMQDANAGTTKAVTVAVTLKNKNYSLTNSNFNTTVDITKAAAPTVANKIINIKKGHASAQEGNVLLTDIMTNAPVGAKITAVAPPALQAAMESVTSDAAKVTYKSKENISVTADEVYDITIESANYEDITAKLIFHPTDKLDAAVSFEGEVPTNKVYGAAEFTVKAKSANKGDGIGTWTWRDNGAGVISVTGNGNTATVKILKAGIATIKVSYASDTTEGGVASANITVEKANVKVKANDKVIYLNDAIPDLTAVPLTQYYTVTGLVGGDALAGAADLAYQKDGVAAAPDNTKAGKYDIVISGLTVPDAANYNDVVFEKGTLEIKERPSSGNSGNSSGSSTGSSNSGNSTTQSQSADQTKPAVTVKNEAAKELVKNITDQMQANHIDKLVENKPMTEKKEAIKALTADTKAKLVEAVLPKYTDVKTDAWYAKDLAVVMTSGLVKGTGANTVSPAKNVTGQEMMAMLVRSMGKEAKESDRKDGESWYDYYKKEAANLKLDQGLTFKLEKDLTRAEVAAMLYKYVKLSVASTLTVNPDALAAVTDMAEIPAEYKEAVAYLYQLGIFKGYEDGSFRPNRNVSRIEVIALLARVLAM